MRDLSKGSDLAGDREEADLSELTRWEAARSQPATVFDVLASGNIKLFAAFVLRAFRAAARVSVEESKRAARVRAAVVEGFAKDAVAAETFLKTPHPELEGQTPLVTAVASDAGAASVIALAGRRRSADDPDSIADRQRRSLSSDCESKDRQASQRCSDD